MYTSPHGGTHVCSTKQSSGADVGSWGTCIHGIVYVHILAIVWGMTRGE